LTSIVRPNPGWSIETCRMHTILRGRPNPGEVWWPQLGGLAAMAAEYLQVLAQKSRLAGIPG
jgi:hypothetical protein